jgi:ABC-type dipeptide/oligopeptide/nickel transport system ATPase component
MAMDIAGVINDFEKTKSRFLVMKGTYNSLLKDREELAIQREEKLKRIDDLTQVKVLLAESSRYAKEQVKTQLETLVTNGLQYVFGEDMRFEIEISDKARTEAEFYVVSMHEGEEIRTRPESARGGGVVDIISIILRVAMLQSCNPPLEGPLLMDEPVKMVSADYIERVGEFFRQLNQYFDRQIIMSTHNVYLAESADKIFEVVQENGISRVETP